MLKNSSFALAAIGLSLALSACGSSDDAAVAEAEAKPEIALSVIQQANFERFNRDEFLTELKGLEEGREDGKAADPADFAALDADASGKLDPAEFALARLPEGAGKDDAQTETVIRSFFALDNDGDTFLTEEEFAAASGAQADEGLADGAEADTSEG